MNYVDQTHLVKALRLCNKNNLSQKANLRSPRNIVLGVFAVVGETSEEEDSVADHGEAVAQPRTWRLPDSRRLRFQPLPLPSAGLEKSSHVTKPFPERPVLSSFKGFLGLAVVSVLRLCSKLSAELKPRESSPIRSGIHQLVAQLTE